MVRDFDLMVKSRSFHVVRLMMTPDHSRSFACFAPSPSITQGPTNFHLANTITILNFLAFALCCHLFTQNHQRIYVGFDRGNRQATGQLQKACFSHSALNLLRTLKRERPQKLQRNERSAATLLTAPV
jgi:hypothetical protein